MYAHNMICECVTGYISGWAGGYVSVYVSRCVSGCISGCTREALPSASYRRAPVD